MQAVILAAGNSSRFYPYNQTFEHKSLIPLVGKTILEHTILSLKKAEITDIIIVTGENSSIPEALGNGERMGVSLSYKVHKNAQGMGAALLEAKNVLHNDFFLLNAYHLDFHEFGRNMLSHKKDAKGVLLGRKETHSSAFGYITVDDNKVTSIIEKPIKIEKDMLRLIGIYLLPADFLDTLSKTPLSHYHFEEALQTYVKNEKVAYVVTEKPSLSLKYPTDLFTIKDYLFSQMTSYISPKASIAKDAIITGTVVIEDNATIMEGVCIKGPAYIGEKVIIGNRAIIRDGVDVAKRVVVGSQMEVKNALLMEGTTTHAGFIGDSLVGQETKIAAGIITANARLDRQSVSIHIKGEKVDTGMRHVGVLIGSNCNIGIRVSTMPGVIIGNNVIVGPSTTVMKDIPDNKKYYTKFQETIEENNEK